MHIEEEIMLKRILAAIERLEKQKKIKLDKQGEIQREIDQIDTKLKRLLSLQKQYEKIQNDLQNELQ